MKVWSFVFGLLVGFCAHAQQVSPVLLGSWMATAGSNQIFRGTWSAQVSLHNPNRAIGSERSKKLPVDAEAQQGGGMDLVL